VADWAQPVLTSLYTDVLAILKERDVDAGSMFIGGNGFNTAPDNSMHFSRARMGGANVFYEKVAGTWTPIAIGVAGGGTGASSAADARTNLGIGTMGTQNANNVAITGGTISGIASFAVSGAITAGSFTGDGAGITNLNASQLATGVIPAARIPDPLPALNSYYLYNLNGSSVTNGLIPAPQLGSGDANSAVFLRGDRVWTVPPSAGGLPAGAVIFFTTPCPPGFTRISGWDGYYVRMGATHVAGGANTHAHTPGTFAAAAHVHAAGTLATPSHNHGGATGSVSISVSISGTTGSGGGHSHGYGGSISGTTGNDKAGSMNCDAGGSGVMSRSSHQHDFGANYSGDTDAVGGHTHSFSGSGSGSGTGSISSQGGMAISGSTASGGGGAITGTSAAANNMPLYIDFFACMKD